MQPFKYVPKLNTGQLRHWIDLYGKVKTKNELNETTYKYQKIKSTWAAIIPQTGRLQKQQVETILSNVTHKVIVRYESDKDITQDMYIMFIGKRFDIKYILNPYFKNETLEIFCEEVIE
ncbi:phage head closure protein [Bacillus sp. JJ1474]|uniref:phage head closure protein n=1 Tax=Bacillus sp. JJ1474 TaxID=3122955 RepID=UPI002FFFFD91